MQKLTKLTNFQQRTLLGLLSALLIFFIVIYSHQTPFQPIFAILLIVMQAFALWEFYKLCAKKGFQSLSKIALYASSAYLFARFLTTQYPHLQFISIAVLFLFAVSSFAVLFKKQDAAIATLATTYFGIGYVTFPFSLLLDINFMRDSGTGTTTPIWIFYLMVVTKSTDMCAYFIGKRFGKTPFMPAISPKKSLEGAIGGLVGAVLTSILFYSSLSTSFSVADLVMLGLVMAIAALFGDLAESLLKRDAKIKDSNVLPGFGGILDMIDSTLFTSPVLYAFLTAKSLI